MVRNRSYAVVGIVLLVLAVSGPVWGQGGKLSELLSPFVSEQTFAVIAIDVAKVNVDATFDVVESVVVEVVGAEHSQEAKAELQKARGEFKQKFGELKAAGGKTGYVLWSLDDLPHPVLAVPLGAGGSDLESWLKENVRSDNDAHVRKEGVLFIGDKRIMERRQSAPAVVRRGRELRAQPLAGYIQQLRAELEDRIPKFKLHFVNSGTIGVEVRMDMAFSMMLSSAPPGSLFRNLWASY